MLLRSDTTNPYMAAVLMFGPAAATPHPVATVDVSAPYGCVPGGRYLACPTTAGPTKVWRSPLT